MHLERNLDTHTLNFFQDILEENFVRPKKLQDGYMKFSDLAAIDNELFLENYEFEEPYNTIQLGSLGHTH